MQIVVEQSALGGGGGNAGMGSLGELLGGKRGNSVWPDALVGDGEGEVGTRLTGVGRGEWDGETELRGGGA